MRAHDDRLVTAVAEPERELRDVLGNATVRGLADESDARHGR